MDPKATLERTTAALRALAAGDAMGRATEHYRPDEIGEVYEEAITEFVEPVRLFDDEIWTAGEIGPPTEVVLAFTPQSEKADAGLPGIRAAVDRLPVALSIGLRYAVPDLPCAPGSLPIAAGIEPSFLAVAAGITAAVDGFTIRDLIRHVMGKAEAIGDGTLVASLAEAVALAETSGGRNAGAILAAAFSPDGGVDALVPFIFGIVYATQSARRAIVEAVNQGGHAPQTAAIAGAICAAALPGTLPRAWGLEVERVNGLDLEAVARRYLAARMAAANTPTR